MLQLLRQEDVSLRVQRPASPIVRALHVQHDRLASHPDDNGCAGCLPLARACCELVSEANELLQRLPSSDAASLLSSILDNDTIFKELLQLELLQHRLNQTVSHPDGSGCVGCNSVEGWERERCGPCGPRTQATSCMTASRLQQRESSTTQRYLQTPPD